MPVSRVFVDLSPLDTPSRFRGIGSYVANLGRALSRLRPEERAGLSLYGLVRPSSRVAGEAVGSLCYTGDLTLRPGRLQYSRYLMRRRFAMNGLTRRLGAELLHLTEARGTPLGERVPLIVTCHDLIPLIMHREYLPRLPLMRSGQRALDRRRYRHAQRIIAISETTKRDLVRELGMDADRIDVVYHGVDHERFDPHEREGERDRLRRKLGIERPYVLYVGGADRRKDLKRLVRAYGLTRRAHDVDLVLAGSLPPWKRRALVAEARGSGLLHRVRFLGYVPANLIAALYRHCSLHVFPSRYEGFGLPVLEAMACGAPTITTGATALGEVAADAARTFAPGSTEELCEAMLALLDDGSLRVHYRSVGIARAAQFSWRRCALATIESYQRALASRS
ncbi:MAG: glycosyltransferase family 4 protein [Proteobacteria bacterium]|nr:glycosyltransferase family 4 protein [Pseudomonadota bacterium]